MKKIMRMLAVMLAICLGTLPVVYAKELRGSLVGAGESYTTEKVRLTEKSNDKNADGKGIYSAIVDTKLKVSDVQAISAKHKKCVNKGKKKDEGTYKVYYYKFDYENKIGNFLDGGFYDAKSPKRHHGASHFVRKYYKVYRTYSQEYYYEVKDEKEKTVTHYFFEYVWSELEDDAYHKSDGDGDLLTYCIAYGDSISQANPTYAQAKKEYDELTDEQKNKISLAVYYGPHMDENGKAMESMQQELSDGSIKILDTSTWTKAFWKRYIATQIYIWYIQSPDFSWTNAKNTAAALDETYSGSKKCLDFLNEIHAYVNSAKKLPSFSSEAVYNETKKTYDAVKGELKSYVFRLKDTDGDGTGDTYLYTFTDKNGVLGEIQKVKAVDCQGVAAKNVSIQVNAGNQTMEVSVPKAALTGDSLSITLGFAKKQTVPVKDLGKIYYANSGVQNMVKSFSKGYVYEGALKLRLNVSDNGRLCIYKTLLETGEPLENTCFYVLTSSKTACVYDPATGTALKDGKGNAISADTYAVAYLYNRRLYACTEENRQMITEQSGAEPTVLYDLVWAANNIGNGNGHYVLVTDENGYAETTDKLLRRKTTTKTDGTTSTAYYTYYLFEVQANPFAEAADWDERVFTDQDGWSGFYTYSAKQAKEDAEWQETGEGEFHLTNHSNAGGLIIEKYDAYKKSKKEGQSAFRGMKGVWFDVYADETCMNPIAACVTDESGIATLDNLTPGRYYVKERVQVQGYLENNEVYGVTIRPDNRETPEIERSRLVVFNYPYTLRLDIVKYLNEEAITSGQQVTEYSLQNAVFGLFAGEDIYDVDGEQLYQKDVMITTLVTGADGTAALDYAFAREHLPLAKYYVKEIEAPNGFRLNEDVFTLDFLTMAAEELAEENPEEGQVEHIMHYTLQVPETVYMAPIRIHKDASEVKDGAEKVLKPLSGAGFSVYDFERLERDGKAGEFFQNGEFFADMFVGKEASFADYRVKISANTENPYEIFTDANGDAETLPVLNGRYIAAETTVPAGVLRAMPQMVTVTGDMKAQDYQPIVLKYEDEKIKEKEEQKKAPIRIHKDASDTSETGERVLTPLSGAGFSVYDIGRMQKDGADMRFLQDGIFSADMFNGQLQELSGYRVQISDSGESPYEIFTDVNGDTGTIPLVSGQYVVAETVVPEGFLQAPAQMITLQGDSSAPDYQLVALQFEDVRITPEVKSLSVRLFKREAGSEKPLEGAVFGLYRKGDDSLVGMYVSDKKGEIYVSNLPLGDYYWKEHKAPEGYAVKDEAVPFQGDETHTEIELVVYNVPNTSLGREEASHDMLYRFGGGSMFLGAGYLFWNMKRKKRKHEK